MIKFSISRTLKSQVHHVPLFITSLRSSTYQLQKVECIVAVVHHVTSRRTYCLLLSKSSVSLPLIRWVVAVILIFFPSPDIFILLQSPDILILLSSPSAAGPREIIWTIFRRITIIPELMSSLQQWIVQSVASNVYETPNGTRYRTPIVPTGFKPFVKARFTTIEQAIAMYEQYAQLAGFGTRLGTSKKEKIGDEIITVRRYVLCSRAKANKPKHKERNPDVVDSTSPSRRSNVKVTHV
ncbi:putative transcription factor FAR family [Helianthus annuus]|nr:putative transcription factor FAR family [Helianthus annuus]